MPRQRSSKRAALRIGAIYVGLAVVLVVLSDWAINRGVSDPALRATVQTATELFFVLGTGGIIVFLVFRELRSRRASEEQLRTLVEQSLAGITVVQNGDFLLVNSRFAEIFGYRPDEIVGSLDVVDVIAPEDRDTVAEKLRQRLEGEVECVSYRYTGLTKDGDEIRINVYGRRIEWKGETAVLSLHLDVTEEERLREQARRSQRLETLGELTGAVAHDFNNLLTAIRTPLDLCDDHISAGSPAREELREAKDAVSRAVTLTRQLLSFSRQRLYRPRPIDLSELVRTMAPMLRRLSGSGVEIELDLAEDLPAVEVDPSHFEQVILNLITNAKEAVEERGTIRIVTGVEGVDSTSRSVLLEVGDDGKGMDHETRTQIFEPFFTTREKGTGLGLSITHGLVTQADGEISVNSTLGEGTTFRILLPASHRTSEPLDEEQVSAAEEHELVTDGATVLVVEDQEPVLRVTVRALERHGFETVSAASGDEALEVFRDRAAEIDLVLTDVGLPDMDGVKLVSRIIDIGPDVKVAYMSGRSDEEVLDHMARESSSVFLEKPFSVEQLVGAVRSAFQPEQGGNLQAG